MALTTIQKEKIAKTIMQNFMDLLKRHIKTITIEDPITHFPKEIEIQTYASRYNDVMLSKKSNYPVIIVNKPSLPQEQLTFRQTLVSGLIKIEVHCTNSLATDKFYDAINTTVDDNRDELSTAGIKDLILDNDDDDTFTRGGFKDHWASATWAFEYNFTNGN